MATRSSVLGRPVGSKGEDTRRRIIAATMRCVAEVGYSRATIREIAGAAQMTSASLYHYFPNKTELLQATFLELAQMSVPRLTAAAEGADGVLDKLAAVLDESEQLVREFPFAVAFDRAIRADGAQDLHLAEDSDTIFSAVHDLIVDIVESAQRQGGLSEETDVVSASNALWAVLRGLYEQAATASADDYRATLAAVKLLLRGSLFRYDNLP